MRCSCTVSFLRLYYHYCRPWEEGNVSVTKMSGLESFVNDVSRLSEEINTTDSNNFISINNNND